VTRLRFEPITSRVSTALLLCQGAQSHTVQFGGTILNVTVLRKTEFGGTEQTMNPKTTIAGKTPIQRQSLN
jgi:hypothetical protein